MSERRIAVCVLMALVCAVWTGAKAFAGEGFLYIASTPDSAVIKVDGTDKGTTPLFITVPSGKRSVQASLKGYVTSTQTAEVQDNEVTKLSFTLSKTTLPASTTAPAVPATQATGNITLITDWQKTKVYLDGFLLDVTLPVTMKNIPQGAHTIVLQNDKYVIARTVNVVAGQTALVKESFDDLKKSIVNRYQAIAEPPKQETTATDTRLTQATMNVQVIIPKIAAKSGDFVQETHAYTITLGYKQAGAADWQKKEVSGTADQPDVFALDKGSYDVQITALHTKTSSFLGTVSMAEKAGEASVTSQKPVDIAAGKTYVLAVSYDGKKTVTYTLGEKK